MTAAPALLSADRPGDDRLGDDLRGDHDAAGGRGASFAARLATAVAALWARAPAHDHDGADPTSLCQPLARGGLFVDALAVDEGGLGMATDPAHAPDLLRALLLIGGCDLSAARLFEGHVNAVKLVTRYGGAAQRAAYAADVRAGAVGGVWNAEAPPGLSLDRAPAPGAPGRLSGGKIYCSGLGLVSRPLVTARLPADGGVLLLAPPFDASPPHDISGWTVRGMRATATGTVDLAGVEVGDEAVIGAPGDYYRSPLFKAGAWRFAAAQAGAALRIAALMRAALQTRGRDGDPHQRARIAAAAGAAETAELWVTRAAALAEGADADPAAADAYVNLARLAVERAALEVIALAERAVGLGAFTRPDPIERVVRDLSTYLRQPFPDAAAEDAAGYLTAHPPAPPWSVAAELPA